jgi:hypothetical protein
VTKAWYATWLVILVVLVALCNAPASDAAVTCDHRGYEHIQRHGGKLADDYWHISRHEPTTCDDRNDGRTPADDDPREEKHHAIDPKDDPLKSHDDKRKDNKGIDIPRNDTPGIGCHLTRCG